MAVNERQGALNRMTLCNVPVAQTVVEPPYYQRRMVLVDVRTPTINRPCVVGVQPVYALCRLGARPVRPKSQRLLAKTLP